MILEELTRTKLVDLQFPADGWRSTWTAWFKKDPELTFNLGGLRQMNKIRIYHQPFERDDELMDVAVWIADEEMNFELLKTILEKWAQLNREGLQTSI